MEKKSTILPPRNGYISHHARVHISHLRISRRGQRPPRQSPRSALLPDVSTSRTRLPEYTGEQLVLSRHTPTQTKIQQQLAHAPCASGSTHTQRELQHTQAHITHARHVAAHRLAHITHAHGSTRVACPSAKNMHDDEHEDPSPPLRHHGRRGRGQQRLNSVTGIMGR